MPESSPIPPTSWVNDRGTWPFYVFVIFLLRYFCFVIGMAKHIEPWSLVRLAAGNPSCWTAAQLHAYGQIECRLILLSSLAGSDYTFRCYLLALSLQTRVAGRLRVQDGKIRQENLLVPPLLLRTANERLHLWIRMGCLMRLLFKQGTDRRWRSLLVE